MDKILYSAEFDKRMVSYNLMTTTVGLLFSCVGIVFMPILLPIVFFTTRLQLKHLECDLTAKQLRVKTGALNRVEKTIPLDKITDMALVQGPIMRAFGIEHLRVETAGSAAGALATIPGVIGAREFRDLVLERRDMLVAGTTMPLPESAAAAPPPLPADEDSLSVLIEIRDSLRRLEDK